jgi:hypothetical protein
VLQEDVRKHLKDIGADKTAGLDKGATVRLSRLEEALWEKAESKGVKMIRSYTATDVMGRDRKPDGTFESMVLTLSEWDEQRKALKAPAATRTLDAGLLAVSIGGGANATRWWKN